MQVHPIPTFDLTRARRGCGVMRRHGRVRFGFCVATVLGVAWMSPAATMAQDSATSESVAETLRTTRDQLSRYTEVQMKISTARNQWRVGREMLQERIEVVQRRIEDLDQEVAEMRSDITEADEQREQLVDENERLKSTASALRDTVSRYESRTKALVAKLPPPAANVVRPLSQRLPENSDETEVSLSNRYQNVIGILNELDKFNQKLSASSQTREVAPGDSREVDTLYVGLGAGYYSGPEGRVGGRGYATTEGWQWTAENDAAPQILEALQIFNNEQTAAFVPLPLVVSGHTDSGETTDATAPEETPGPDTAIEDSASQESAAAASDDAAGGDTQAEDTATNE